MNTTTKPESSALTTTSSGALAEQSTSTSALVLNVDLINRMMQFAEMMARGIATVPKHLQKNPADCLAVVMQATQWGMNPFAVAQKTHLVNGTLGYEAQLVNAVLQATGAIDGDFSYEYRGAGAQLECRVGAVPKGAKEIKWNDWLSISLVTTRNSPLWKTNPPQQMGYLQVKNWARAYKPAALLGVYTINELEENIPKNMGPAVEAISHQLVTQAQAAAAKGVAAYQEFWKATGQDNRKLLASYHDDCKQRATEADRARTVDQSTGEIRETAAPAPAANTPVKSFDEVMTMLCGAKNIDQLYIAGDWIGTVDDFDQQNMLSAKFEEIKAKLEGGAA